MGQLVIDKNQFGFSEKSNTLSACINCTEYIYENLDRKKYVAMLAIDLTKAFDTVNLKIMLLKLAELGFSEKSLQFFKSFLTNRKQFVQTRNFTSGKRTVRAGVPQGSKLAATLFLIYINNALKLCLNGVPQFYADDGAFIYAANSMEEVLNNMQKDLKILTEWFDKNLLKINLKKTNFIVFNNFRTVPDLGQLPGIFFNGCFIQRLEKIKYLGAWFDSNLNWSEHVNNLKLKLLPLNFMIYRNRKILPKKDLWLLYNSYFLSQINYLNPIWTRCSEQKLSELQRLQNKIIKNILFLPRQTASTSLYESRLDIRKYSILQTLLTVFKIKHNLIKHNLNINEIEQPVYNFRNYHNIRPRFFRTD